MCRKIMAVGMIAALLVAAIIYTTPSADSTIESQPPNLLVAPDEHTIIFPSGGGSNRSYKMSIHSDYTVVEASINLIGLEVLDSIQPGLYEVVTKDPADDISTDPVIVTDIFNDHFVFWIDTGSINSAKEGTDVFVQQYDSVTMSWQPIIMLSHNSPKSYASGVSAVTDSMGNIHVVWSENGNALPNGGPDNDIFYRFWNGASWSTTELLSDDGNDGNSITPKIAVDSAGLPHVIWVDDGNINGSGSDNDIIYRYRTGATWSQSEVLSNDANDGDSIEPAITAYRNTFFITWSDDGNIAGSGSDFDIIFQYGPPGAWSPQMIASADPDDGASHNPSIIANSTTIFIAWEDNGPIKSSGNDNDIYYIYFDYIYNMLGNITLITDDIDFGESVQPEMILDNFDNIYIAWADSGNALDSGPDWDIFYRYVDRNGIVDPELLTDDTTAGISGNVSFCLNPLNNHIQFVWVDTANIFGSGTDEDIFIKELNFLYQYPMNLKLDIGANGVNEWSHPGIFDSEIILEGDWLSLKLTSLVEEGEDSAINDYVEIPFVFNSDSSGVVHVSEVYLKGTATPSKPENITIDGEDPLHVIDHDPVFNWTFVDTDSKCQGRYEVEIGTEPGNNDIWDPVAIVGSNTSIIYTGDKNLLLDGATYYFRVRVADCDGSKWSPWSDNFKFRMNSIPSVTSLSPATGSFDQIVPLTWSGKDPENDPLLFTIEAYYELDQQWHTVVEDYDGTSYNWNVTKIAEQSIDIECYVSDGFEKNTTSGKTAGKIFIVHNTPPRFQMLSPLVHTIVVEKTYIIEWEIEDPDEDDTLTIALYYDEDMDRTDKHLIIENYSGRNFYKWDTTDVPKGSYYIYGVITDGTDSAWTYSNSTIELGVDPEPLPPLVTSISPEGDETLVDIETNIVVTFSKSIDDSTLNKNTVIVRDSGAKDIDGRRYYNPVIRELTFDPKSSLEYGTEYTVILTSEIKDTEGVKLDGNRNGIGGEGTADDYTWSFTTLLKEEDFTHPEVISTNPVNDETNVSIRTTIKVNFSEPIDPLTLNNRSFFVITQDQAKSWDRDSFESLVYNHIKGSVSYNNELNQAIFTPINNIPFEYNTKYIVILTQNIRDNNGNYLMGNTELETDSLKDPLYPYMFSFTTEPETVPEEDNNGITRERVFEVIPWEYVYFMFIILLVVIIAVITWFVRSRILMGPIRIRDVFIIYRDGRLLYHYRPNRDELEGRGDIDEGAVSSMLTAIQDFVKDSFKFSRGSSLNELRHGTLKILIEHGDNSYVAVVCSGGPTSKIREEMKNIIYDLNIKYSLVLRKWDGNMNSIAGIDKLIVPLILMEKDTGKDDGQINRVPEDDEPEEPDPRF